MRGCAAAGEIVLLYNTPLVLDARGRRDETRANEIYTAGLRVRDHILLFLQYIVSSHGVTGRGGALTMRDRHAPREAVFETTFSRDHHRANGRCQCGPQLRSDT